jgi:heme-degrading monooxygenase HmoA
MVVIVFRSRSKGPQADAAAAPIGARMFELATQMPGFVSYKDFVAEDGESVSIVEFDTLEHLQAWRTHPEHVAAQERGRRELFSDYRVQVCQLLRESRFPS